MNSSEIYASLKPVLGDKFYGVFASDKLPSMEEAAEGEASFVANNKRHNKAGEHWCAFYFYDNLTQMDFFDSYGLGIEWYKDFYDHFSNNNSTQLNSYCYNTGAIQDLDSDICGLYCIMFLYLRHKKQFKMLDILSLYGANNIWNDCYTLQFCMDNIKVDRSLVEKMQTYQSCIKFRKFIE
jgi:hypothetical protein